MKKINIEILCDLPSNEICKEVKKVRFGKKHCILRKHPSKWREMYKLYLADWKTIKKCEINGFTNQLVENFETIEIERYDDGFYKI